MTRNNNLLVAIIFTGIQRVAMLCSCWQRRSLIGMFLVGAVCAVFTSGCATSRPLPKAYLEQDHEATVVMKRIRDKPQMQDSGQGGLIGALITATSRSSNMKEKMAGIQGETVKELLLQELNRRVAEHFVLNQKTNDLKFDVTILTWGWFVPTTVLGIKTGAYQCQIVGRVDVYDVQQKMKRVAFVPVTVQKPLGNKPEEVAAKEAIIEAAQQFAVQAETFLLHPVIAAK